MKRISFVFTMLLVSACALASVASTSVADPVETAQVFATVGDIRITRDEFEREVYSEARQTFYHGRPPGPEEFIEFRKTVADNLINRKLLIQEAKRREIEPDMADIDARIVVYEERYGDTERWQTEGPQMIAMLRARFEEDSMLELLEQTVRSAAAPGESSVRHFYEENPALFTEPAQNRVSLILLGVAPSAGATAWQAAREEAGRVVEQLEKGASFEELASLHSSDPSATAGGDMGFQHAGRLGGGPEAVIDSLEVGEISEPVQVLEGMAIFKLTERRPEQLRPYPAVRPRAEELWLRQQGDRQWHELIAELRSRSPIDVDAEYLATLPGAAD